MDRKKLAEVQPNPADIGEQAKPDARVLVIVTGGTIIMKRNKDGELVPDKKYLEEYIESSPVLNDRSYVKTLPYDADALGKCYALPKSWNLERRVTYCLFQWDEIIDSSNMTIKDYKMMATDIKKYYSSFDGFVILHGTDTMAYTASYLSFMLENLGKTVVLTGSQIPLSETRSDGVDNMVSALVIAGIYDIPEVTLLFNKALYRGSRVRKVDCGSFSAFLSPNMDALARMGIDISVNWGLIRSSPSPDSTFTVHLDMEENVGILRLIPGITTETIRANLNLPVKGFVLQTYGSGNGPSDRKDMLDELHNATMRGVQIVNCTQCERGSVTDNYETGDALSKAGLISGYDITPEAALAKLSYVLSCRQLSPEEQRKMLRENLRGEITKPDEKLRLQSIESVRDTHFSLLLFFAAKKDNIETLQRLISQGADIRALDYDERTCLHVAASEGRPRAVEFLLQQGASADARDRFGKTPLDNAIEFKNTDCVDLLRSPENM